MAEREQSAVLTRLEQLYHEYNKLSEVFRKQNNMTEGALLLDTVDEISGIADMTSVRSFKREVKKLKNQIEELVTEKNKVEKAFQQHKNDSIKQIDRLKREVLDLKDDAEVLKDVLKRLNEELNRYHIKHGKLPSIETTANKKEISHSSLYKFSGLLRAYDELLMERDNTIRNTNEKLGNIMVEVNSVTAENEKLHTSLEKLQSQTPQGAEEAELIAADARLLLEERELLVEELQQQQECNKEMDAHYHQQVQDLKHKIQEYDLKNRNLASELETWKTKCMQLEKKCNFMQNQLEGSVSQQEHEMAVKQCQRLFDDLRRAYKQESGNMKGKMNSVKSERKNLAEKLVDTNDYLHKLRGKVSGLKGSLRKCESHMDRRTRALKTLQTTVRLTHGRLKALASICSELLEDREKLLNALMIQKEEREKLLKQVTLRSATVGALSQKLKEERLLWSERVAEKEGAMKMARAAWRRSTRESSHLRGLLTTKDDTIASLISDYKQLGYNGRMTKYENSANIRKLSAKPP